MSQEGACSEFLLRLCHDLRSCLRAIQPHTEMLAKDGQTVSAEDFQKRLGYVLDGGRRLDSLLSGLAGYAIALQLDSADFRSISLDTALRNALMVVEKQHQGIRDKVSSDALPRVTGDPDRLQQVFEILIRGALDRAAGKETRLRIGAAEQEGAWAISVHDESGAVAPAVLEKMFRPMERWDGRNPLDSGFGLATCRLIVERHGGRMWAEPEGSGSAFRFTIPAIRN